MRSAHALGLDLASARLEPSTRFNHHSRARSASNLLNRKCQTPTAT